MRPGRPDVICEHLKFRQQCSICTKPERATMNRPSADDIEMIFGMETKALLDVKKKLQIMGVEITDILTFLDRDKVQLFAEQQSEIIYLKKRIADIKKTVEG